MKKPISPCYDSTKYRDCPNRKVGCRTGCAAWQEFQSGQEAYREMVNKERFKENANMDYLNDTRKKIRRLINASN